MTAVLAIHNPETESLQEMTQERMLELFNACFGFSEQALMLAALLLAEWQRRDLDTTPLEAIAKDWVYRLRLIFHGQLLPKLAADFYYRKQLLDHFARFNLDDQRVVADDKPVPVVTRDGSKTDHLLVPPSRLIGTKEQFRQVFARDHIRDEGEQVLYLEEERRKAARPKPATAGKLVIDRDRNGAMCGRHFIPFADLQAAVRALQK